MSRLPIFVSRIADAVSRIADAVRELFGDAASTAPEWGPGSSTLSGLPPHPTGAIEMMGGPWPPPRLRAIWPAAPAFGGGPRPPFFAGAFEAGLDGSSSKGHRVPLPMQSQNKEWKPHRVKPGEIFKVVARPQVCAFRPEKIEIEKQPGDWNLHDIKVGGRSQLIAAGILPGAAFGPDRNMILSLETVQTAMDFELVVGYVGEDPEGRVFEATVLGTAAM